MIYLKYVTAAISTSIGILPFFLIIALIIYWFLNLFFSHGHDKTEVPIKSKRINAFFSSCSAGVFSAYLSFLGGTHVFSGSISGVISFTGHVIATFLTFTIISMYVQRKARKLAQPENQTDLK